jgi:hypothetical protein
MPCREKQQKNSSDSIKHGCLHSCLQRSWQQALLQIRRGANPLRDFLKSPILGWQLLMGVWLYGLFAGVSYAAQTRNRLHEKETMAARAEVLAAAARLDAIRARLNPHFLFNALHTLAALVKFHPGLAESAIQRLGDMLRYALKEDGRELVEFAEEYEFTGQYIAFEQLRYEDRLKVDFQIDPESFQFDIPPFSIQTLAENAVHHAISIRPKVIDLMFIWNCCDCDRAQPGTHLCRSHLIRLYNSVTILARHNLQYSHGKLKDERSWPRPRPLADFHSDSPKVRFANRYLAIKTDRIRLEIRTSCLLAPPWPLRPPPLPQAGNIESENRSP